MYTYQLKRSLGEWILQIFSNSNKTFNCHWLKLILASYHSINSSKSGMCLNRLAKHGPISSDLINRRLGLNVLTNITSMEMKRLIRWVTYTILKIFDTHEQEDASLRPLLSIQHNCYFFMGKCVSFWNRDCSRIHWLVENTTKKTCVKYCNFHNRWRNLFVEKYQVLSNLPFGS